MGNTRYYTKDNGQSFAELEYDVWGAVTSPSKLTNNDNGNFAAANFTGHPYDTVLDIYFAEARFYDAKHRQWMASDPIKSGLNWYAYAESNPSTYWDADGLDTYAIGMEIGGSILGLRGSFDIGIVVDDHFNVGVFVTGAVGGGTPSDVVFEIIRLLDLGSVGISGIFSYTNADTIQGFAGEGTSIGGSINIGEPAGVSIGFDVTIGYNKEGPPVYGFTVSLGAAAKLPFEMHGVATKTWVFTYDDISQTVGKFVYDHITSYFVKMICEKQRDDMQKILWKMISGELP